MDGCHGNSLSGHANQLIARQINVQSLSERFRPFVQSGERGVQGLAGFQPRQRRRIDSHPLRHLGQCQSLAFPCGFESNHQIENRGETLSTHDAGRTAANRVGQVLPADGGFLSPLFGGALGFHRWFHGFTR